MRVYSRRYSRRKRTFHLLEYILACVSFVRETRLDRWVTMIRLLVVLRAGTSDVPSFDEQRGHIEQLRR